MAASARSLLLWTCIVAAAFCTVQGEHEGHPHLTTQPSCLEYCDLRLTTPELENSTLLRKGEEMVHPTDPCQIIRCNGMNEVQFLVVECKVPENCPDGGAPYRVPGTCCLGCMYRTASKFTFGGDEFDDGNATLVEVEPEIPIPIPQTWGEWSAWTECSQSCGSGRQARMRECNQTLRSALDCSGDRVQIRECSTHPCPVDGNWTEWSEWTECSLTCGDGSKTKNRSCTNPAPAHGGRECEGERIEISHCFLRHCPVDCVWLDWTEWGECSHECGGGAQYRTRDKAAERHGGRPCDGESTESRDCNTHHCPVDGGWSTWAQWTDCSVSCNDGTQTRRRACDSPAPAYDGEDCDGVDEETRGCNLRPCPIDCVWYDWSEWDECSLSCDGGTKRRTRGWSAAMYGGRECIGAAEEVVSCNTQRCPDPCVDDGHPCFNENVTCTKRTDTEYECGPCPRGMDGDGIECVAVNECDIENPCFEGVECIDYDNGFACDACPSGYRGNSVRGYDLADAEIMQQVCVDIDECTEIPNGGCHQYRSCTNIPGGYFCGECIGGYVKDGDTGCILVDPCAAGEHNCAKNDYCINHAIGEYHCECPVGYIGNGLECSPDHDLDGIPSEPLLVGCDHPPCPVDNCPDKPNSLQMDSDRDGVGDACDDDSDNDGIPNEDDNCRFISNPLQTDSDRDGFGDECDNCPDDSNTDQLDTDGDGDGNACDVDRDGDGVINTVDKCPDIRNPDQNDRDKDGRGDACDNCPRNKNFDQQDEDQDGMGDVCDTNEDTDRDGIQDEYDNCYKKANSDQADHDGDGMGDMCDTDDDNDGVPDTRDNCPLVSNPSQTDTDGNGVGDDCEGDMDGDGVNDAMDVCPRNAKIQRTDFSQGFLPVSLYPSGRYQPIWKINDNGTEVIEMVQSDPGLLVGQDMFSNVEFNGTFFVDSENDDDILGIVFNYQSNHRFMVVSWKRSNQSFYIETKSPVYATCGIQVKRVKSNNGPGSSMRNAMWHSANTRKESTTIWKDPTYHGWEHRHAYKWNLQYTSRYSTMRFKVYDGLTGHMIADTGCVHDTVIKGGRLGVYAFSQDHIIFSNMRYSCLSEDQENALSSAQCPHN